jgi:hypothetical protein
MKFTRFLIVIVFLFSSFAYASDEHIEDAFSPKQGATELITSTIAQAHKTIRVAAYTPDRVWAERT